MTHLFEGKVGRAEKREYGKAELYIDDDTNVLEGLVMVRSFG